MYFVGFKLVFVVLFRNVLVLKEIPMKMAKIWPFLLQLDTPTPRRRSAHLGVGLRLGGGPYA